MLIQLSTKHSVVIGAQIDSFQKQDYKRNSSITALRKITWQENFVFEFPIPLFVLFFFFFKVISLSHSHKIFLLFKGSKSVIYFHHESLGSPCGICILLNYGKLLISDHLSLTDISVSYGLTKYGKPISYLKNQCPHSAVTVQVSYGLNIHSGIPALLYLDICFEQIT